MALSIVASNRIAKLIFGCELVCPQISLPCLVRRNSGLGH